MRRKLSLRVYAQRDIDPINLGENYITYLVIGKDLKLNNIYVWKFEDEYNSLYIRSNYSLSLVTTVNLPI